LSKSQKSTTKRNSGTPILRFTNEEEIYVYPIGSIIQRTLEEKGPSSIYNHVGIYVGGSDHQVIHYSQKDWTEKKRKATIIKTSLDEFKCIRGKEVKVTIREKPKDEEHGRAICEEAEKIYRNPVEYKDKYHAFFHNCEDFAKHCYEVKYKSGRQWKTHTYPRIPQSDKTAGGVGVGILGLVGLVVGILFKRK
jgi:hypothetical protein